MLNNESRPGHLPDFKKPPLNEVVLGVQFSRPKGYQQIYAGEVWGLFKSEFPTVEEHHPIAPVFETFGRPKSGQLGIIKGPSHDRFWFLNQKGDELIQFQQDRLLHNWRKAGDSANEYPRFESMIERFNDELGKLEDYLNSLSQQDLVINQCEVTYINHIVPKESDAFIASRWLRYVVFDHDEPEDFSVNFREIIYNDDKNPQGRFICESSTARDIDGNRIIVMTLTVRGAPKGTDIKSALNFLSKGRETIVSRFADLTTDEAHEIWERIK